MLCSEVGAADPLIIECCAPMPMWGSTVDIIGTMSWLPGHDDLATHKVLDSKWCKKVCVNSFEP